MARNVADLMWEMLEKSEQDNAFNPGSDVSFKLSCT
jgi:hypothetical protein